MKKLAVSLTFGAILLVGCNSTDTSQSTEEIVEISKSEYEELLAIKDNFQESIESSTDSEVSPEETNDKFYNLGEEVDTNGLLLTVEEFKESENISVYEKGIVQEAAEILTQTPSRKGAKFISVSTHIKNNTGEPMDLTCSLPVGTSLYDENDNRFTSIDDLYLIEGNPECNDDLNPGFDAKMTWVYEVPKDFDISKAYFGYYNGQTDYSNTTFVKNN